MKRHLSPGFHRMRNFGLVLLSTLLILAISNSRVVAQEAVKEQPEAELEVDVAPVTVDGEDLFMGRRCHC